MTKISQFIVKFKIPILILAVLLMIPSVAGMANTRINYDMLNYLPSNLETIQGQDILLDEFGKGAFSLIIVDGMDAKNVAVIEKKIEAVESVDSVVWYDDIADISVPMKLLPSKYYNAFNNGSATLMAVFFQTSTSEEATMRAISQIRAITGRQCFVTGLSALVTDLKALCEKEEPIYVAIAVTLACAAMMLLLDSWIAPLIFLLSIGMAILYNFGTNIFVGEISYITKALSAVMQLAVTMDYSIFLWHSYCEEKDKYSDHRQAMALAITNTMRSVAGSSLTTVAGFIALCFMTFKLGLDIGIVMAKGVVLGVVSCVTILPALILLFDKPLAKTMHKPLLPPMERLSRLIARRPWVFLIVFAVLIAPAYYGYSHSNVYYDLGNALPKGIDYVIANSKLKDNFNIGSTHLALVDSKLSQKDTNEMIQQLNAVPGVKQTLGLDSVMGADVPEKIVPQTVKKLLQSDKHKLLLINSNYQVASDEVNSQIDALNKILKSYDKGSMLIGEAPCTKDMIRLTSHDFEVVNIISIVAIFIIIAVVLKSASLPVVLLVVIEFAIFINLGIPYYTKLSLPFIAPICISTIQLGSTVDYAILLTNRYIKERFSGLAKHEAAVVALNASIPSIIVSACGFFAATVGVAFYSNIDIISSMCKLMARGAIVSLLSVIFILPAFFMVFDKAICKTTWLYNKLPKAQRLQAE
ncbi:efflux RND transporter permease subunit [Acetanaerobacterium elongatum]|uniref:Membrane transport protein MMPL domain-containing protein n=1 Tax=Acetanaerobacterium elongatum TaxID=258515 RepID=A0A1H0EF16_9FIRM|nr:MMPL family transporter [Acetanaerobacterium elongatum]SDN80876.1 hypothetical protein SAMN05192585_1337 [Acetanaerobacterium elongatum]